MATIHIKHETKEKLSDRRVSLMIETRKEFTYNDVIAFLLDQQTKRENEEHE